MNDFEGKPDRKVTIRDVAREAGVSAQTVSRVINNKGEIRPETRQAVLEVIDRLGYRPSSIARGLAIRKTFTIGLVVPDIANPFFAEVARGVEDLAWQQEYSVILCNSGEDARRERAAILSLQDKQVDGVVLCSPRLPDGDLMPLLQPGPTVFINRDGPIAVVQTDDAHGVDLALAHLRALGRRHVGLLAGPEASQSGQRRRAAFRSALPKIGEQLIEFCAPTYEGGQEALGRLLDRVSDIDGLIAHNDLVAIGAVQAAAQRGLSVPGDLAVIGHDDAPAAAMIRPSLTTLRIDKHAMGQAAGQMLLDWITNNTSPRTQVLQPSLIVRDSAPNP